MEPIHFIGPVFAMVIAGLLVGAQKKSISRLEVENRILRQHIEVEKSRSEGVTRETGPRRVHVSKGENDPIDWVKIAESMGEAERPGGVTDMRAMISLQRKLRDMDTAELVAALERISLLEMDDMQRLMLEGAIIGPLITKDPELALTTFSDRIGDTKNGMSWQLGNALEAWAKKDPAAATAWFDREIEAGTFDSKALDGRNHVRSNFEGSLITQLLRSDPAAAAARIAVFPADQQMEVLGVMTHKQLGEQEEVAFADLVRKQLQSEQALELIGRRASNLAARGDLDEVGEYIDLVAASPEERIRCAEDAARGSIRNGVFQNKDSAGKIDSMREWLGSQSPGSVDKITGEAVGNLTQYQEMKFSEASELVLKYHEISGSDDLLTGFLENSQFFENKDDARVIAEKISDPDKRKGALGRLE